MRIAALLLCPILLLTTPAMAQRVLEKREAQAVHCASMFLMGGGVLHLTREINDAEFNTVKLAAAVMLSNVGGTRAQKYRTVQNYARQRYYNEPEKLVADFRRSRFWCLNTFIK